MKLVPDFRILLGAAFLLTGCQTLQDSRQAAAREQLAAENQRITLDTLRAKVEGLEQSQADLARQVQELRSAGDRDRAELRAGAASTDKSFKALEAARAADRQHIIDDLSARIPEVVQRLTPPSRPPIASRTGEGYEHVVQAGETLSAIAAAYKVSAAAIAELNGLKNVNALRVGQKLIIPE